MPQPATPFEAIGGQESVAAIVGRFYDLMDTDPAYRDLRALHAADLSAVRNGLALFLNGWMGGPRDWFAQGKCVMSLHRPLAIPPQVADQWIDAMARAIAAQPGVDTALAGEMAERLGQMARAMINQPAVGQAEVAGASAA
tara:strand:- start:186 stop:608 length:423 start_codon:yes stop_codon:yes gene_type:complete